MGHSVKNGRANRAVLIALGLSAGLLGGSCARPPVPDMVVSATPATDIPAVDPPPVRSYPSPPERIQAWIDAMDAARIRAHGWDVWASITTATVYSGRPVWETWYSGYELFEVGPTARTSRRSLRDFERPRQIHRPDAAAAIPPPPPGERPTAFNRYSASVANYVWDKGYNNSTVLDAINAEFDRRHTPVVQREIQTSPGPVDPKSIVLKPVFQFISGTVPTAVPVWSGISPAATTNLANPTADSWRRCVVVDPTGKLRTGSAAVMPCNAEPPAPHRVVSLSDFFGLRLTEDDVKNFSEFAATSGDDVGQGNKTDRDSILAMLKVGNIALLVAMHVTTKEIANWTWQTFWWAHNPQDPISGGDRPDFIRRPWSHYNMGTAYYMVSPPTRPDGDPLISFNPYLETNLSGTVPGPKAPIQWTGVDSNCMSCHRMAAWKRNPNGKPGQWGSSPPYYPDGLISPADPALFDGYTKLDFLWSLTRARPATRP